MTCVNHTDIERRLRSFVKDKDITLPEEKLRIDGKIHRYATDEDKLGAKAGAYQIWPDGKNHDGKPHGWIKDWRQGITIPWQYYGKDNPSPIENRTPEESAQAMAKSEADKRAQSDIRNKASVQARQIWEDAKSVKEVEHPYLKKKDVRVYGDMRISTDGKLLIFPWRDIQTSKLVTIHTINGIGDKRWHKGAPKRGGYVIESNNDENNPVIITEGAATALSIYEALSFRNTVIAAGDCGSLKYAADAARRRWPEREIYIAADDDWKSEQSGGKNHGLEAASLSLKASLADGILMPPFSRDSSDTTDEQTDWNDYTAAFGLNSTRDALEKQIGAAREAKKNAGLPKEKHDGETALSEAAKRPKADMAIIFYQMVKELSAEVFRDEETGSPLIKYSSDERIIIDWLHSERFESSMFKKFFLQEHSTINSAKIAQGLKLLDDDANNAQKQRTYIRLAAHHDAIYLDLCDEGSNVVKIDAEGWGIVTNPPVIFRQGESSLPLPCPQHGGSLDMLKEFACTDDDGFVLLVGWLLSALNPQGGFPILVISSEAGSGKSTTTTLLSRLIDPNIADRLSPFKDEGDLVSSATSRWIVPFDNVSGLSPDKSDALCRLATGGGLSKRKLYTDNENFTCAIKRPAILNGIELNLSRLDLLDRATILSLKTIPKRRVEDEIYADFAKQRPFILGALLDAVSAALRGRNWKPERLPRMADAVAFVLRAEKHGGLPWAEGTYQQALDAAEVAKRKIAIDNDLVGNAILRLVLDESKDNAWTGSMSDLHTEIFGMVDSNQIRYLPQTSSTLSRKLTELAPLLRQEDIVIERKRSAKGSLISIRHKDADMSNNAGMEF